MDTPKALGYTMEDEPQGFAIATLIDAARFVAVKAGRREIIFGKDKWVQAYREANVFLTEHLLTKVVGK